MSWTPATVCIESDDPGSPGSSLRGSQTDRGVTERRLPPLRGERQGAWDLGGSLGSRARHLETGLMVTG